MSNVVDDYKQTHKDEIIVPPEPGHRGSLTACLVDNAESEDQYIELVREWAVNVYDAFNKGHAISKIIADMFREKYRKSSH